MSKHKKSVKKTKNQYKRVNYTHVKVILSTKYFKVTVTKLKLKPSHNCLLKPKLKEVKTHPAAIRHREDPNDPNDMSTLAKMKTDCLRSWKQ